MRSYLKCENGHVFHMRDAEVHSKDNVVYLVCSVPGCQTDKMEPVPEAVINAIEKAWPDQAKEILDGLRFAGDHYSFNRWGMYVGVEMDGYCHT